MKKTFNNENLREGFFLSVIGFVIILFLMVMFKFTEKGDVIFKYTGDVLVDLHQKIQYYSLWIVSMLLFFFGIFKIIKSTIVPVK
jgi:hypothetical protein